MVKPTKKDPGMDPELQEALDTAGVDPWFGIPETMDQTTLAGIDVNICHGGKHNPRLVIRMCEDFMNRLAEKVKGGDHLTGLPSVGARCFAAEESDAYNLREWLGPLGSKEAQRVRSAYLAHLAGQGDLDADLKGDAVARIADGIRALANWGIPQRDIPPFLVIEIPPLPPESRDAAVTYFPPYRAPGQDSYDDEPGGLMACSPDLLPYVDANTLRLAGLSEEQIQKIHAKKKED